MQYVFKIIPKNQRQIKSERGKKQNNALLSAASGARFFGSTAQSLKIPPHWRFISSKAQRQTGNNAFDIANNYDDKICFTLSKIAILRFQCTIASQTRKNCAPNHLSRMNGLRLLLIIKIAKNRLPMEIPRTAC